MLDVLCLQNCQRAQFLIGTQNPLRFCWIGKPVLTRNYRECIVGREAIWGALGASISFLTELKQRLGSILKPTSPLKHGPIWSGVVYHAGRMDGKNIFFLTSLIRWDYYLFCFCKMEPQMMSCFVFLAFAFSENVGCIRGRVGPKVTEKVSRASCYHVILCDVGEYTNTGLPHRGIRWKPSKNSCIVEYIAREPTCS